MALTVVLGSAAASRSAAAEPRSEPVPDVLIINSYAPGYQWSDDMLSGLLGVLKARHKDIEPVILFLDARRFPDPGREEWLLRDIESKVRVRPPRLVITLDNAAFDFARKYRATFGPGVPLVFGGLNRFLPEMIAGDRDITGVSEESDFSGTFQLIQSLRPQARKVLVISNPSPSAVETLRVFRTFVPRYADRYEFEFFDTWTNDELFARLNGLGDEWVAVILDATRDREGRDNYNNTAFSLALAAHRRAPVFVNSRPPGARDTKVEPWDVIGGGLVVADLHGATVGELAVRVLDGEDADAIPVIPHTPQRLEVEYVRMKDLGLSLDLLPPGTRVNNAPVSFVSLDRTTVAVALLTFVVMAAIITALLLNVLWRHRAELALRKAEEHMRASQKLEAVGLLAGGVAHDFNNMLQVIRGHAGFLRESLARSGGPDLEDVQAIEQAGERATQLTRQLLAFSRKQALSFTPVDPNALVSNMAAMLRRLLGEHIELDVKLLPDPCALLADKGQLEQVILNLCVNARDAMPSGGRIHLELRRVALGAIDLSESSELKPGPHLMLSVSDNGTGMPPEVRRHIFEPFFTTKPMGKGTGLGLAVVYGIVRQHDGAIRVYSEVGKGTVFRVLLPVRAGADHTGSPEAHEDFARGQGTVLLAEDDAQVRRVAERILTGNGFHVLSAVDGQAALELADRHRGEIRLAVLDVLMPRLSGRQVFDHLRARDPGVRVLFCSGYSADMLPPEIAPGDGFALLTKPYTSRELLEQIHRLLRE